MVVGKRGETIDEKTIRHIKELEEEIVSWEFELEFARKKHCKKYEDFCILMIDAYINTIKQLEKFAVDNFIDIKVDTQNV